MDPTIEVRTSPIEGRGLFATAQLPIDHVAVRLGGELVKTVELQRRLDAVETADDSTFIDSIAIYGDAHLVLPDRSDAHFGNHSCDPNLWYVGPFDLVTRRSVEPGEELTIDYGTVSGAPGFSMVCTCSATGCRGVVTSNDWKRRELRVRYGNHWTPALLVRIA